MELQVSAATVRRAAPSRLELSWTTPAGTPRFLAVDSYFQVGESNESNNLYTLSAP